MSHVMFHVSGHMSRVTCHMSRVIFFYFIFFLFFFFGQSGEALSFKIIEKSGEALSFKIISVEGLLSTGPTPSSFFSFFFGQSG